jgi:hypothetical protein
MRVLATGHYLSEKKNWGMPPPRFSHNPKYPLKIILSKPQGPLPPRVPKTVPLWIGANPVIPKRKDMFQYFTRYCETKWFFFNEIIENFT